MNYIGGFLITNYSCYFKTNNIPPPPSELRITEDSNNRITEDGQFRVTE